MSASVKNSDWQEIGIPGFSNVVNSRLSVIRRLVWGLAIIVCIFICISQISERIRFYLYSPVAVKVTLENDASPPLPHITICSDSYNLRGPAYTNPIYLNKKDEDLVNITHFDSILNLRNVAIINSEAAVYFRHVWQTSDCTFFELFNLTVNEMWKLREIPRQNVDLSAKVKGGDLKMMKFELKRFNDEMGPCITLKLENVSGIEEMKLTIKNNFPLYQQLSIYWMIYHQDEFPVTPEIQKTSEILSHYEFFSSMQINQFVNINFTRNPCVSSEEYLKCRENCIRRELETTYTTCKFPITLDDHIKRPVCLSHYMCVVAINQLRDAIHLHDPNKCKCRRKCVNIVYTAATTKSGNVMDQVWYRFGIVNIKMPQSFVKAEEFVAYNLVALFCDIGSSLGLCMGLCLISVLEIIQNVILAFKKQLSNA